MEGSRRVGVPLRKGGLMPSAGVNMEATRKEEEEEEEESDDVGGRRGGATSSSGKRSLVEWRKRMHAPH